MPHNILDSDFLEGKEEELIEQVEVKKSWWDIYLQDGEQIVFQQDLLKEADSSIVKAKPIRNPFDYRGLFELCLFILGMLMFCLVAAFFVLDFLEEYSILGYISYWLLVFLLHFFVAAFNKYNKKRVLKRISIVEKQEIPKSPTQQLILTKRQLIIEDKRRVFIDDILTTKVDRTAQSRVTIELKRAKSLEFRPQRLKEANKLIETIEQLRFG
ncbi:MAG: hypothetical protein GY810_17210 [Aureispira sp.]|nr:hypothetical protein [Aureispira sp.]